MKKTNKYLYIAFLTLFSSCSFLDTAPEDTKVAEEYFNNEEELVTSLMGVYCTLANTSLYGGNMLGRMGLCADIGYESYSSDEGTVGYYDVVTSDAKIAGYWRYFYQGIGNANLLIQNIDKAPSVPQENRDRYLAEARFLRAYYYFMLTVRFGDIPLIIKTPASCSMEDLQIPQTPQSEVYDFIIAEMEASVDALPEITELSGGGRLSKSAAGGIIARVCLNAAGFPCYKTELYDKAASWAKKVIDLGYHQLNADYKQVFINYMQDIYDTRESIWEIEFYGNNTGTYTTTAGMVGRNNGIGFSNSGGLRDDIGVSIGTVRTTQYYYNLFEEGDLRRDWTIADYTYNSTTGEKVSQPTNIWIRYSGKFRREYEVLMPKSVSYTPTNFPLLRYADVLLMYAEAVSCSENSSAGDVTEAYECLNRVRRRGFGKSVDVPDPSVDLAEDGKESLLDYIKDERARELGHEFLRKDDIVRWGEFYNRMSMIRQTVPAGYTSSYYVAARMAYSSVRQRDYRWPIPSYEMTLNRKLVQNEGW